MTRLIYAYTVIGKDAEPWRRKIGRALVEGAGLIKVGETTKSTARARIKQQLGTAYPDLEGVNILLDEPATREDGSQFGDRDRSEEHTSELQSLMRTSYAVFCLKKKNILTTKRLKTHS